MWFLRNWDENLQHEIFELMFFFWVFFAGFKGGDMMKHILTWNPWACRHTSGKVAVPAIWYATKTRCLWRNKGVEGKDESSTARCSTCGENPQNIEYLHLSSLHNFSCEPFLLKKTAQLFFPKTMESTYLWVLFAPSVCGVLHQSSTSGFTAEQEADVLSLSPDAPVADRQKGVEYFFGKAGRLSQKTAGHGNNGTNQRFLWNFENDLECFF